MAKNTLYVVVIENRDQRKYAVSPPVPPQCVQDWLSEVCRLQDQGQSIYCQDVNAGEQQPIISRLEAKTYSRVSVEDLIQAPRDRGNDFQGALPKYAAPADRAKVVKILCRGKCGTTRFAQLNMPYPGQDVLRSAPMHEYEATCLRCGKVAIDSYNWHR